MSKLFSLPALMLLLLLILTGLSYSTYQSTHRRFTYVIVHGAYGGGWAFGEVADMMVAEGHRVFRPTLTGQGEKVHLASPDVNLETHIQDIVNAILFENLHDVVLVGHSYGGMVITGVADRIPDRIKCLIYLDGIVPENGESADTADHGILHHATNIKLDSHGSIPIASSIMKKPLPHDEPMPAGAFRQPISLKNQSVTRKLPSCYILFIGKGSQAKDAHFFAFYERARTLGWHTETFVSDHNPQWSQPRALVQLLERLP